MPMDFYNQTSVKEFVFLVFSSSTRCPVLLFVLFLFIYMVIILVNASLTIVIKSDSNLHTPMYFFIWNLACLDIFYTSTVVPQVLSNLLNPEQGVSFVQCATQTFCIDTFGGTQIFLVTVMAYDRYVAIANPLCYKTVMNWTICKMFLVTVWLLSSMIAITMVLSVFLLPFCKPLMINHFYCEVGEVFLLTCATSKIHDMVQLLDLLLGFCMFTIPFLLVATSYVYIIAAIMRIRTNEGRRKVFYTCSSHLTIVVVEYVFLGCIYFRTDTTYSVDKDRVLILAFTFSTPILNPLIYSVRNKAVKSGFLKLIYHKPLAV